MSIPWFRHGIAVSIPWIMPCCFLMVCPGAVASSQSLLVAGAASGSESGQASSAQLQQAQTTYSSPGVVTGGGGIGDLAAAPNVGKARGKL